MEQDPVKVDPKHYKVEVENDRVRVLRIKYGAREKSPMHHHPDGVLVYLSDSLAKFTFPNGETAEIRGQAGETIWLEGGSHEPENLGGTPFEVILVELKR